MNDLWEAWTTCGLIVVATAVAFGVGIVLFQCIYMLLTS